MMMFDCEFDIEHFALFKQYEPFSLSKLSVRDINNQLVILARINLDRNRSFNVNNLSFILDEAYDEFVMKGIYRDVYGYYC